MASDWTTILPVLVSFLSASLAISAVALVGLGRREARLRETAWGPWADRGESAEGKGFGRETLEMGRTERLSAYRDFVGWARVAMHDLALISSGETGGVAWGPVAMVKNLRSSTEGLGRSLAAMELVASPEVLDFARAFYGSVGSCEGQIRRQMEGMEGPPSDSVYSWERNEDMAREREFLWERNLGKRWPKIAAAVAGEYTRQEVEILYREVRDRMRKDLSYAPLEPQTADLAEEDLSRL